MERSGILIHLRTERSGVLILLRKHSTWFYKRDRKVGAEGFVERSGILILLRKHSTSPKEEIQ